MIRNRKTYALCVIITIVLGLMSRSSIIPDLIYPYMGDYLYAIMFFLIIGFLFTQHSSSAIAIMSILICYLIELSQLFQADWLNAIRSYKIGSLVLGHGFLWSDIISYTLGGITGYIWESVHYKELLKKLKP